MKFFNTIPVFNEVVIFLQTWQARIQLKLEQWCDDYEQSLSNLINGHNNRGGKLGVIKSQLVAKKQIEATVVANIIEYLVQCALASQKRISFC